MKVDRGRLAELKQRAQQAIDDGHLPACQYALARDGEVLAHETLGAAPADARFAMWSATKPVFASVGWQLIGEGKLSPTEQVVALWPEFGGNGKVVVTIDHLLLFTAGFPQATLDLNTVADRAARVRQMQTWTLEWEPGSAFQYHGFSAHYVLAELVARATGTDHRAALRERVLDPLGLGRLELGVARDRQCDIQNMVETGDRAPISEVIGVLGLTELPAGWEAMLAPAVGAVGSSPAVGLRALERPEVREAGIPGAGAVSDAASVALFYQALLHNQARVWDPEVLHDVTANVRNAYPGADLGVLAMRTRAGTAGKRPHCNVPVQRGRSIVAHFRPWRCRRSDRLGRSGHRTFVRISHQRRGQKRRPPGAPNSTTERSCCGMRRMTNGRRRFR